MAQNNSKNTSTIWRFIDDAGSFYLDNPGQFGRLYFPLANESGMLSNITPKLKGSIKSGHNSYLTLPVSIEDLHISKSSRNFWILKDGEKLWSATGVSKNKGAYEEHVSLEAGLLWHKLVRENKTLGLKSEFINFVPSNGDCVEVMLATIENTNSKIMDIEATAAVPVYARSADNVRDHRHVTSLLHRIEVVRHGVQVTPTMTFDERGHHINILTYSVLGYDAHGAAPEFIYPTVDSFIGEGGSFEYPKSLFEKRPSKVNLRFAQGKEAMGAMTFKKRPLKPGEKATYIIVMRIAKQNGEPKPLSTSYATPAKVLKALDQTKAHWNKKAKQVHFKTHDPIFDQWIIWVGVQPIFRKLFGNSFLPDFDYGRGGRGWRDLWQDCLALLLTNPDETCPMLLHNYGGIRVDGSNATIISGENLSFIADRNQITRVWMDHGTWPFLTTALYIHESGNVNFLFKKAPYFRDPQLSRAKWKDFSWSDSYGMKLKTKAKKVYQGTLLEHILVQHLVQFFNVGKHHHILLENADWNDGLDMAHDRGESVAFTSLYAGNLNEIADILQYAVYTQKIKTIEIFKELAMLLDARKSEKTRYSSYNYKRHLLEKYFKTAQPEISGTTVKVPIQEVIHDLRAKADFLIKNIRSKEWVTTESGYSFYNGYYDNNSRRVEGDHDLGVRMTLTGQVFSTLCGIANDDQVREIIRSVSKYLKDPKLGGIRLNTDFMEVRPDLGRAFSFAYGEKENGAFFNHMQVMFANALYSRGFVKEGYSVLHNIFQMSTNTAVSKIYPGLPEYFNLEGRGMYHYLTGSASWYFMTLLTESFGVKGHFGDLLLEPKLVKDQFEAKGRVQVKTVFADRTLEIEYSNPEMHEHGHYQIHEARLNGKKVISEIQASDAVLISRKALEKLPRNKTHQLKISLCKKKKSMKEKNLHLNPLLIEQLQRQLRRTTDGQAGFKEEKLSQLPDLSQLSFKHL
jgi:cellobiose phosphorylase